ncbi:MAG: UDP-2,3-diacylglucosamine diphosphatase LpxI [Nitrospiraceae bacterium]|nr:UDP-2,3-diacylglucosamine diphosphatase LpxI [Nitrospiraceae bacterium]
MQIGLLAGAGELPVIIAADAKKRGYRVVTVALENLASEALASESGVFKWVNPGKLGEIIDTFRENGITEAVMAGKVPKALLYKSKIIPDMRAVKLLFSLKDKSDNAILEALTKELEKDGIKIIDTTRFSPHLLTPEGSITKSKPSSDEWSDIKYGWNIAKEIGRMDIGQTVVVKGRSVMAVEAVEGTDEAIRRGSRLANGGAVVVKVSKPQQDLRLDVPAIGIETLKTMSESDARVLALEAGKSIIINRQELAAEADRLGISIVGVTGEGMKA